ncbi:hypothetical protein Gasu2_24490 [Galdieria sulphuraria]|nr:hypothetical protein Gasu2_24490 [Galdieria sulphuraria]
MQAEDWRIATKALVVLHRLINESSEGDAHVIKMQLLQMSRYGVDSSLFPKNTSQYSKIVVDIGNLNATFEDHSRNRPEAPVCSAFLKKYGRYVSRRLEVFQFLSSQSTIYSFNELGILKENMGENSLGEETLCIFPVLIQLVREGTLCKIPESIDKAVEVVIAPALEQIASDVTYLYNFLNRILKKLSVDLVNNKNLSKSSLKIAYDDFVRLEPEIQKSSKWNLEEEEQQKANAMEETVSIGPQDSNDKDSSRSDMEQSNNNNNNNNGEVNTLKHKVGMYSEVYSSSREQQLLRAAFIGLKEEVSCLIEAGVSTNVCDDDMRTPLHLAAAVGHVDIVKLLLDAGAEVNAMDCRVLWRLDLISIFSKAALHPTV